MTMKQILISVPDSTDYSVDFSNETKAVVLPADLFLLLKDVRPYVEDMVGIASSARSTLWSLDEFLKLENK